jgi:hypothetical protein
VNLGQALALAPPEWEAEIAEGSSWSCAHGVERWRSDCGCQVGAEPGWTQAWRAPLLAALEGLRDRLGELYERELAPVLPDPWAARDAYVDVVLDPERREALPFVRRRAGRPLAPEEETKALRLLEMQRAALLMFTSCGWFFAELSGLETVQVLKYAARAIQLARDATGVDLEVAFENALARAPSNVPELGDGRRVWQALVKPSVVTLEGVAAHLAIASAVHETPAEGRVFRYAYRLEARRSAQSGPATLTLGRTSLVSAATGEAIDVVSCVLHLGAADFRCGIMPWRGPDAFAELEAELFGKLARLSIHRVLREVDRFFPGRDYGLGDLFLDERRRVAGVIVQERILRYEGRYREIFEGNRRLMEFLREIDSPVPAPLRVAADVTFTARLRELMRRARGGELDLVEAEAELGEIVEASRRLGARPWLGTVRRDVEALVLERLGALAAGRAPAARAAEAAGILALAERLGLRVDLWQAQNRFWAWAGSGPVTLERDVTAELARRLWFDVGAVLARAGYAAGG